MSTYLIFPFFDLWAKFELNSEEDALIAKYRVRKHILVQGKPLQRFWAAILGIILAGVIAAILHSYLGAQLITLLIFVGGAILLYHQFREEIRVSDILDGRHFACRSVVKLIAKEQEIAEMAHAFRHLLEAMKNWGGREIIELEQYKQPVLRMIEPPQGEAIGGEAREDLTPVWIGWFVGITGLIGIGGYLFFARPGATSKPTHEPSFIRMLPRSNLPSTSVTQTTPAIQQPDIWRESLQESDIRVVLSLGENKLLQVKNLAARLSPPKQGNRRAARAANDRGLAYLQSGRIADALNAFQEAYRTNPADIEIVNNLGYAYMLNNDPITAETYLLTTLAMRWDRSAAWSNLGQAYTKKGDMPAAVASLSNAYRFSRDLNQTHQFLLDMMGK